MLGGGAAFDQAHCSLWLAVRRQERATDIFAQHAVSTDRLEFLARVPFQNYLGLYHAIDVALDPFPFAGGTTSFDALLMGAPLITLRGQTAVGRGGVSILSNLGLTEFVADSPADYLRLASQLAADIPRLRQWRTTLRPRVLASPLMNAPRFARNIEAAYRQMWRSWCTS